MVRITVVLLGFIMGWSNLALGQVSLGVRGSAQLATEKFTANGVDIKTGNVVGFQAGLMLKMPIRAQFSVRPQLLYSTKGFTLAGSQFGLPIDVKAVLNYLEVPVQLAYSLRLGAGSLVVGAGPYAAYALNGTSTTMRNGQSQTEPLDFGTSDAQKRFDFGLNLSIGYELNAGLGVSAYYSPGLANLTQSRNGVDVNVRNTAAGLSLGYFFGGNR